MARIAYNAAHMKSGLISLKASSAIDATKPLPDRLLFLKWGANPSRYGDIKVNEITLAAVPVNQEKARFDHVAIDFQHNSVKDSKFYMGEPVKLAARKARVEVVKGEGIYLSGIDWLIDAETARSYPDLSLCPKVDKDMNVVFVHSGALCRQGEVEGIELPLAADPFNTAGEQSTMDYKKLICTMLGLDPEKATDAEIEAAAKQCAEEEAGEGEHKELAATVTKLEGRLLVLEAADVVRERETLLTLAAHAGKEVPASVLPDKDGKGGLDNAALKTFIDGLPATVPVEKRTGNVLPLAAVATATTEDDKIRAQMGITKERWEKRD